MSAGLGGGRGRGVCFENDYARMARFADTLTWLPSCVRDRFAAVQVLEAAYGESPSVEAWLRRIAEACYELMDGGMGIGTMLVERQLDGYRCHADAASGFGYEPDCFRREVEGVAPTMLDPLLGHYVVVRSTVLPTMPEDGARVVASIDRVLPRHTDQLGLCARPGGAYVFTVAAMHERNIEMSAANRRFLTRVAVHVECGLRLQLFPKTVVAVLRPDGRVEHAVDAISATRTRLREHVEAIEKVRTLRRRRSDGALDHWTALVSGRYGFVERIDSDGKRHYVVVEDARASPHRRFTPAEARVVELAARGLSNKLVGYALGITSSAVSSTLMSAALKAGCQSRSGLVALASRLLRTEQMGRGSPALTPAERQVLKLVQRGLSNEAIARDRGRSTRTVANQVAALLRKLKAPSRRALAAY